MKKKILAIVFSLLFFAAFTKSVYAVKYSLIPPSGNLTRGQDIQFIISIDTQGQNITAATVGMNYDTRYLQYTGTTPGSSMSSVTASDQGTDPSDPNKHDLLMNGSSPSGFTGSGDFAFVNFKIIATASGSTELCALFAPSTTPSPTVITPTSPAGPTSVPTVAPTSAPGVQPTSGPLPTALPKTGSTDSTNSYAIAGLGSLALFIALRLILKQ